jgi:hypothetical protein
MKPNWQTDKNNKHCVLNITSDGAKIHIWESIDGHWRWEALGMEGAAVSAKSAQEQSVAAIRSRCKELMDMLS